MSEPINQGTPPPPPPPGSYTPPLHGGGAPPSRGQIEGMVAGPAISLIVVAAIGMAFGLLSLLVNLAGVGMMGMESGGMDDSEMLSMMTSGSIGILTSLIGLAIGAFIIWAALQMKGLRNYTLAMTASIVIMVPCISPCCILGIPAGIWALVILMKPEVKAAFS